MNTLSFILLSFLVREPSSGYDLAQYMQRRVGLLWPVRHSQVYPELAKLEAAGMVTHERVEQEDRPDKKLFAVTATGRDALTVWAASPSDMAPLRDEFLIKSYSQWLGDRQAIVANFRSQAQAHRERLLAQETLLEFLRREWGEEALHRHDGPGFGSLSLIEFNVRYERAYIEWCEWAIGELSGG